MVRVWAAGPVAAEAWGAGWAKEWDEGKVEDRVEGAWARGAAAIWVLRATAVDCPAGRLQEPPQMVGGRPAVAC